MKTESRPHTKAKKALAKRLGVDHRDYTLRELQGMAKNRHPKSKIVQPKQESQLPRTVGEFSCVDRLADIIGSPDDIQTVLRTAHQGRAYPAAKVLSLATGKVFQVGVSDTEGFKLYHVCPQGRLSQEQWEAARVIALGLRIWQTAKP